MKLQFFNAASEIFTSDFEQLLQSADDPCLTNSLKFIRDIYNKLSIRVESDSSSSINLLLSDLQRETCILKEYSWDLLHSTHWKDVPPLYKDCFALATLIIISIVEYKGGINDIDISNLISTADRGILMGAGRFTAQLLKVIHRLKSLLATDTDLAKPTYFSFECTHRRRCYPAPVSRPPMQTRRGIPIVDSPTLLDFQQRFLNPGVPAVLKGCIDHWPAFGGTDSVNDDVDLGTGGQPFLMLLRNPRTRHWGDNNYWRRVCGPRLVPVETGRNYLSVGSGQQLMTVNQFIDRYIECDRCKKARRQVSDDESSSVAQLTGYLDEVNHHFIHAISEPPSKRSRSGENDNNVNNYDHDHDDSDDDFKENAVGYLAQHRLLDQVPELRQDIAVPDYCALLSTEDEHFLENSCINPHDDINSGDYSGGTTQARPCNVEMPEVLVHVWLGPPVTESPLHHDPYNNLLAQVHGYKYVRLYSPSESNLLYPQEGRMYNNSEVDVLNPDLVRHPLFSGATYSEVMLVPGDMLFIPRWTWHFVMALDHLCSGAASYTTKAVKGSHVGCCGSDLSTGVSHSASVSFWWGPRIEWQQGKE